MSRTLTLPDDVFNKLANGAAQHDLTVEALLNLVSELLVLPERPGMQERERHRRVERLFAKYRTGSITAKDRAELEQFIDIEYREANARADRLIAQKEAQPDVRRSNKRSRK